MYHFLSFDFMIMWLGFGVEEGKNAIEARQLLPMSHNQERTFITMETPCEL